MIYEFISVAMPNSDGDFVVTFNRQFRPNWLQRLVGMKARDEYVKYIGYGTHWWDLYEGRKVPTPVQEQCTLIAKRFNYVQPANRESVRRESFAETCWQHDRRQPLH